MPATTVVDFVKTLSQLRPASTFLVLHRYKNARGEVADYNILFHISYKNALQKSLDVVRAFIPAEGNNLQQQAKDELIASYTQSLTNIDETKVDEIDDSYARFFDEDNKYIKGIKMHRTTQQLHLYGLVHQKRIITAIIYPTKNSRALTIEKNKIRKLCPVNRFRQFKILPNQLEKISVEKQTLLPPDPLEFNPDDFLDEE